MSPLLPMLLAATIAPMVAAPPADGFLRTLAQYCGGAYAGQVVDAGVPDSGFGGRVLIMQISECSDDQVRMPFQVSDDRAHALVVTRTASGLNLEHAHELEPGAPEALSSYGGNATHGTDTRQDFHVDAASAARLQRAGIRRADGNVWTLEVIDERMLRYELVHADGRSVVIEFDLANPIPVEETVLAYSARLHGGERYVSATIE